MLHFCFLFLQCRNNLTEKNKIFLFCFASNLERCHCLAFLNHLNIDKNVSYLLLNHLVYLNWYLLRTQWKPGIYREVIQKISRWAEETGRIHFHKGQQKACDGRFAREEKEELLSNGIKHSRKGNLNIFKFFIIFYIISLVLSIIGVKFLEHTLKCN